MGYEYLAPAGAQHHLQHAFNVSCILLRERLTVYPVFTFVLCAPDGGAGIPLLIEDDGSDEK